MSRDERGTTLVEVLMTVMVMGIAFVVLLGGMATSVLSSDAHEEQARAEVEVRTFAELVKQAGYRPSGDYGDVYTPPSGVERVSPEPVVCRNASGGVASCTAAYVVQFVTVGVRIAEADITETIQVTKRP